MNLTRNKHTVLIVDDTPLNIDILDDILNVQYTIKVALNGEKALKKAGSRKPPDIILLDIMMPDMDGYEVCQHLKQDPKTRDIPIIFVTSKSDVSDETRGLELGAVDYITKPFSPPIVKARVATHLKMRENMLELERLYSMALDANPVSGLPGNNSVAKRIKQALHNNEKVCVIYSDLDNFKAFNDKYGFALGDEAIMFASNIFKDAVRTVKTPDAFIGHIGGDDFVVIVPSDKAHLTAYEIIRQFDKGITRFYSPEDAAAKCINTLNRKGKLQTFPIMSISLAGVDLSYQCYKRYVEVNDACADAKKMAKAVQGSNFFMDRRTSSQSVSDPPFDGALL